MDRFVDRVTLVKDGLWYTLGKSPMREACAEFLATFVLVALGDAVMASCVLGRLNTNSVLAEAFGWGFAVMIAVTIAGGVSGGHINPAVTLSLAAGKKCAWKYVIPNITAQYLGSFLAAAVVHITYMDAIETFDGGIRQIPPALNATAQIFATYPQNFASTYTCILDQIIGSALLLILICAAIDMSNLRIPPHFLPLVIGLGVTGILLAFGHNCGAPLNPARDFAPRFLTSINGWGVGVFEYRNYEWFWVPVVAPHVGGVIGVWIYKALIELPIKNYDRLSIGNPEFVSDLQCPEFLNKGTTMIPVAADDDDDLCRSNLQSQKRNEETSILVADEPQSISFPEKSNVDVAEAV